MADIAFEKDLSVVETGIEGLKVVDLAVHGDSRGWFKENWQRAKMCALGIPDLRVVQNNVSYNDSRGVTRGIHAEPWDKFISVARGSVFGAWVDLREGSATYGKVFTCTLDPSRAIYVPRGVGNSFQALEDGTAYTYLVDAHWSLELKRTYTFVNLADPELAIEWPIPLDQATVSEADLNHPMLKDVVPMAPKRTLVTGCNGQLGRAVRALAEERGIAKDFDFCDIDTFDMSDPDAYAQYDWSLYGTVINCGAYTAVDKAETPEGRVIAWKANATGPALLARTCAGHGITLVHVSSDYVFDGTAEVHTEEEPLSPLSVYGQTKAAGDIAVAGCPRHYIMRSSWVIGEGHNFVKTMKGLSDRVADPDDKLDKVTVVDDQLGRLTFTRDMAAAIFHVLDAKAPYGTYDCTGSGAVRSWADIARAVFDAANGNGERVVPVSTADYYAGAAGPIAPRPVHSALDLSRLESVGFHMPDWEEELGEYLNYLERAFDLFGLADPAAFLATATRESFDELLVRLRVEENLDPDFDRYPRLKLHDDASCFMLRLWGEAEPIGRWLILGREVMKYVFLDTCVIVDCAFARKEKSSPKLLERLMGRLGDSGVKLILPEVVQLELEKVLPQTMSVAVESFGAVKKSVQDVAENSLLSHSAKVKLLDAVKAARAELNSDVKDALELINHISNESDRCVVLPLIQEDIIVATKMAIKGNKPSKSKAEWGLVQEDCLIIAALERFMNDNPGVEMAICSSNTDDFATKASDGKGYTLHEQIASRLVGCRFYSNPVDLMTDETFMSKENEEMADKETLKSSYEAASQAIKTMSQKNAESVAAASRALLKYNLSNHYSDMAAQIPSSLSKVGLATDSFAKISAMARQNQLNALSSYLEAIDSIKWNQIGLARSALDNVGFGETDGGNIEDDVE